VRQEERKNEDPPIKRIRHCVKHNQNQVKLVLQKDIRINQVVDMAGQALVGIFHG
jgi:hypothetical protein